MTENPIAGKKKADSSVIPLSKYDETDELMPLNFKVPPEFHREYKLYAVQHGMSMVDLLQLSFQHFRSQKKR